MKKNLPVLIAIISILTLISGLVQMIAPSFVLGIVGASQTATSQYFFALVGMFMVLFGGLMLATVYQAPVNRTAVVFCALQKLGACIAVTIGFSRGLFALSALGIALFDGFSGLLFLYYLKTLNYQETDATLGSPRSGVGQETPALHNP
jgi:hypothetical protein